MNPSHLRAALNDRRVRFVLTGGGTAILFYLLTFGFVRAGASPFLGTLAAYVIAFVTSYSVQSTWTFSGAHAHARTFPRYLAAQIACALLSAAVARTSAAFDAPPAVMALASTAAASACSYLLSRYWVFTTQP